MPKSLADKVYCTSMEKLMTVLKRMRKLGEFPAASSVVFRRSEFKPMLLLQLLPKVPAWKVHEESEIGVGGGISSNQIQCHIHTLDPNPTF